jgi:hypothetical protein
MRADLIGAGPAQTTKGLGCGLSLIRMHMRSCSVGSTVAEYRQLIGLEALP